MACVQHADLNTKQIQLVKEDPLFPTVEHLRSDSTTSFMKSWTASNNPNLAHFEGVRHKVYMPYTCALPAAC
jgi:hypothetical protein